MARGRGQKRLGLAAAELVDVCKTLHAAHDALIRVTSTYPIKFDPTETYGGAHEA